MNLRSLKARYWTLLGLLGGLVLGMGAVVSGRNERVGGAGFISQREFEQAVRAAGGGGEPYAKSVVVHPHELVDWVTLDVADQKSGYYVNVSFAAPRPYVPKDGTPPKVQISNPQSSIRNDPDGTPPTQISNPQSSIRNDAEGTNSHAQISNPQSSIRNDPPYSVWDYLADAARSNPAVAPAYAWWDEAWAVVLIWGLGGAAAAGGVWPLVLRAVYGPPPESRVEPCVRPGPPAADKPATVDDADRKRLEDLEAEMIAGLGPDSGAAVPPVDAAAGAADGPVRAMADDPLAAAPQTPGERKDYVGEYYPVEKKGTGER